MPEVSNVGHQGCNSSIRPRVKTIPGLSNARHQGCSSNTLAHNKTNMRQACNRARPRSSASRPSKGQWAVAAWEEFRSQGLPRSNALRVEMVAGNEVVVVVKAAEDRAALITILKIIFLNQMYHAGVMPASAKSRTWSKNERSVIVDYNWLPLQEISKS